MSLRIDNQMWWILTGLFSLLVTASVAGFILSRTVRGEAGRATVANLNARVRAWWRMSAVFLFVLLAGSVWTLVLFGMLSVLALREYLTLIETRRADHRTLFWSFFIFTPLQYLLLADRWYGLFSIMVPVFAFVFVPLRIVLAGDTERFLDRAAQIQWGLMIATYCLSHAPGLLILEIPGYEGQNAKLLLWLVVVTQMSDVLQYIWGKLAGSRPVAPAVSPNKTWEGFVGGVLSATLLGALLGPVTPFDFWPAAAIALTVTLMGFAGGLVMSAIKRDRGVKDYGTLIEGHGGVLDRIDSLCFAAPVFFHIVRYFYVP